MDMDVCVYIDNDDDDDDVDDVDVVDDDDALSTLVRISSTILCYPTLTVQIIAVIISLSNLHRSFNV